VGGEGRERKYGQHGQRYWQWSTRALYLCGDCTPRMCTAVVLVWLWSGLVWQDYIVRITTNYGLGLSHYASVQHTLHHECTLRIIIRTHTSYTHSGKSIVYPVSVTLHTYSVYYRYMYITVSLRLIWQFGCTEQ
jgi:hypothetical protein